jgi:hypothetical protein
MGMETDPISEILCTVCYTTCSEVQNSRYASAPIGIKTNNYKIITTFLQRKKTFFALVGYNVIGLALGFY